MIKKISVLGCGWLGFPLAQTLVSQGYEVNGSTTSEQKVDRLKEESIDPFVVSFPSETAALPEFLNTDLLVLNIPPGTRKDPSGKQYLATLNQLIPFISNSGVKHLIYTSSTSVYKSENKEVKEKYVRSQSPLLEAEKLLTNSLNIPVTTLRLGGLLGPDRTLLRFFSGKEKTGGNLPVNYVFLDDVINAINTIITMKPKESATYNICADLHPTKQEFYDTHCERKGLPLPIFTGDKKAWKIIDNSAFKKAFDFNYKYPNPLTFPL